MTRALWRSAILGAAGWSMLASWLAWPAAAEVKMENPRVAEAARLMTAFAERTGLDPEGPGKRYLWTDAFAVCNFVGLAEVTGEERYRGLAVRLVDRVHHTLGRHRADDSRKGWLSGLDDRRAEEHPTLGGLRIGKELPERRPQDPFDERLEWDRDGQYFHYLTRWMHALDVVARATREPRFNRWGRELAAAAHDGFTSDPQGPDAAHGVEDEHRSGRGRWCRQWGFTIRSRAWSPCSSSRPRPPPSTPAPGRISGGRRPASPR